LSVVTDEQSRAELATDLDELVREGARRMLAAALEGFFGAAAGLSASLITRLAAQWQAERRAFLAQDLADRCPVVGDPLDVGAVVVGRGSIPTEMVSLWTSRPRWIEARCEVTVQGCVAALRLV